jgi:hypothetical protein
MVKTFKKTTKKVDDLLSEKKSFGSFATGAMTLKALTASGVKIEANTSGFAGDKTSVKFSYADAAAGVALTNLTLHGDAKKTADLGLEFSDLIPDTVIGFNAGLTAASKTDSVTVNAAYSKGKVAADFSMSLLDTMSFVKKDLDSGNLAKIEVMTDVKDFTLGGVLGINAAAGKVEPSLNLLAGYKTDDLSAFISTSGMKKDDLTVGLSAYYQFSSALGAAAKIGSDKTFEVGTSYALDSDTSFTSKASYASGASSVPLSFCLKQKLRPSVELSLPFQFEAAKNGAMSLKQFGFALAMGDL